LFHALIFIPGADLRVGILSKSFTEAPSPGTARQRILVETIFRMIGKVQRTKDKKVAGRKPGKRQFPVTVRPIQLPS
jgi:hypothetical protein